MKIFSCTCFLILCVLSTILAKPSSGGESPGEHFRLPDPVSTKFKSINFTVSPRIELIAVVQSISRYPSVFGFLMVKDTFQYRAEVESKFGDFRNHPAVQMFEKLALQPRKLNFSAPSAIILYVDNHLNLRGDLRLDDLVLARAGGKDSLLIFLDLLKDFADRSDFNKFYGCHAGYYNRIISRTIGELDSVDFIYELKRFYGKKQKSYNIDLVSLYSFVGYGNSIVYQDDGREVFDIMGPQSVRNDLPFFGDVRYLKEMIRHEFSHPFVNSLTEKYWDTIKSFSSRYDSIPEIAKERVCGDWQECINEFTIRAIATHLAFNESKELGSWVYEKEKSRGVSYLDQSLSQIEYYDKNRTYYPTFESFYPEILNVFKD